LHAQGLYLVDATPVRRETVGARARISRRELSLFTHNLHSIVAGGVPLLLGLGDIARQTPQRAFRRVLEDVISALNDGASLSAAFAGHPHVFPVDYTRMVAAGEESGRLDDVLERLVHLLDWHEEVRAQLRQLFTYPAIVLTALIGLVVLLVGWVVPRFRGIFDTLGVSLPLPTRVLLAVSDGFLQNWPLLVVVSVASAIAFFVMRRLPRVRAAMDALLLRLPVIGELRLSLVSSMVAHFLGAFIGSGVPVTQGLDLLAGMVGNSKIAAALREVRERILKGETLTRAFAAVQVFPPLVLRMIAIGEESGTLPQSLAKAEEYYNREIPRRVKRLVDLTGPALTILMGAILCVVLLAVLLPIYQLYNSLH
jgi:type IV pilus assembly protein PilC